MKTVSYDMRITHFLKEGIFLQFLFRAARWINFNPTFNSAWNCRKIHSLRIWDFLISEETGLLNLEVGTWFQTLIVPLFLVRFRQTWVCLKEKKTFKTFIVNIIQIKVRLFFYFSLWNMIFEEQLFRLRRCAPQPRFSWTRKLACRKVEN